MTGEIRVFVLKPGEDWIVDTMARDFESRTSHTIVDRPQEADVVWMMGSWCWDQIVRHLSGRVVICTVHHIVPDKFDAAQFLVRDQFVSLYHVYTQETAEIVRRHTSKPIVFAPTGSTQIGGFLSRGMRQETVSKFRKMSLSWDHSSGTQRDVTSSLQSLRRVPISSAIS